MCFFLFTLTLLICNRYTHFYSFCLLPRVIFVLLTTQAAGLGDAEQALGMTCWSATGRGSRESACLCWTGSSGHQRPPPWLWGFPFNSAPLLIPGPSPQPPSGGRWACPRPMATGCQAGGREQGGDWAGAPEVVRGALVRRQPGTGSARPVRACVRACPRACRRCAGRAAAEGAMRLGCGAFAAGCVAVEVLGVALFLRGFFPPPVRSSSQPEPPAAPEPSAGTAPPPGRPWPEQPPPEPLGAGLSLTPPRPLSGRPRLRVRPTT